MTHKENPNYYAILPSKVRYDKSLNPMARIIYGEITALCNEEGYCWASNSYFANRYGVDRSSVSRWIKNLTEKGYIRVKLIYRDGMPVIDERHIFLNEVIPVPGNMRNTEGPEESPPSSEDAKEETDPSPIPHDEREPHEDGGGAELHQGGGANMQQGVAKIRERILNINNKYNNKAAAASGEKSQTEKPPNAAAAAFSDKEIENLKNHFKKLDTHLIFDSSFYPKLLQFMLSRDLPVDFLSFMYNYCAEKKPHNLSGYLFKVFFEERYVALFREASKPEEKKERKPVFISCPVCGAGHKEDDPKCPACGLHNSASPKDIEIHKMFLLLSNEKREEYSKKEKEIYSAYGFKGKPHILALQKEYGLIKEF